MLPEKALQDILEAYLLVLHTELCRVMWNKNQKLYSSPFLNTGERYSNSVFEVRAYDWSDTPEVPWNFKWKHIELCWYKHFKRGLQSKEPLVLEDMVQMFEECRDSILKEDLLNEF